MKARIGMAKYKIKYRFVAAAVKGSESKRFRFSTEEELLFFLKVKKYPIASQAAQVAGKTATTRTFFRSSTDYIMVVDRAIVDPFLGSISVEKTIPQGPRVPVALV